MKTLYLPQLDGLRGLAILAVILSHTLPPGIPGVVGVLAGRAGVLLFFVLSGFLITGILLRYRDQPNRAQVLKAFYMRRILRIFPLYFLTIAVVAALGYAPVREHFAWLVTYTANLAPGVAGADLGYAGHLWSLGVEEQFYLLWPFVVLLTPSRWLHRVILGVILASVGYRVVGVLLRWDWLAIVWPLPGAMDALAFGALLAFYRHEPARYHHAYRRLFLYGTVATLALVLLEAVARFFPRGEYGVPILPGYAVFHGLLIAWTAVPFVELCARGGVRLLAWEPLRYLGKISYGVYLFQSFLLLVLPRHFAVILIASVLLASLSWRFWEQPFNRLKDRYAYTTWPAHHPTQVATPSPTVTTGSLPT